MDNYFQLSNRYIIDKKNIYVYADIPNAQYVVITTVVYTYMFEVM